MGEGREMFFMGGWGGGNIFWVSGCGCTFFMGAWVVGGGVLWVAWVGWTFFIGG